VAAALDPHLSSDLRSVIFGDIPLHHTSRVQPALFTVPARWEDIAAGGSVAFGIGHSVGELATACLAGVLSSAMRQAHRDRGRLIGSLPPIVR
jgi:acyl transferase domain-containing protein